MSANEIIRGALAPTGLTCVPDTHVPGAGTYYTFTVYTVPTAWGNNSPDAEICSVSVHLWGPSKDNLLALRAKTRRLLHNAGMTWPSEIDASDEDGQHYLYECQVLQPVPREA